MEVCVPFSESSCRDSCSSGGSLRNPESTSLNNPTDISVSDLKTCLTEILVEDGIDVKSFGGNDVCNEIVEKKIKEKDSVEGKSTSSASERCLNKCATFPLVREPKATVDGFFIKENQEEGIIEAVVSEVNASAHSVNQSCSRSISLPTAPRLLSALKGSREKHGIQLKKLSITWAPDVYDPIPSSVSHVPSSKNQRYRNDGKRKNKQKRSGSKFSRGSKDWEKKQSRKNVGTSHNKLKPILNEDSGITAFTENVARASDFAVGNPNPSCGSSLMKDPVTKMHYSVMEAS